jgi:hypothetical protein
VILPFKIVVENGLTPFGRPWHIWGNFGFRKEASMRKCLIGWLVAILVVGGWGIVFAKKKETKKVEVKVEKAKELKKKAQEYWNYKVKRIYYKMYDFECSDVHKKLTRDEYVQMFGKVLMLNEAKVKGVRGEGKDSARVVVGVKGVIVPAAKSISLDIQDPWRLEKNGWCHIFEVKGKPLNKLPVMVDEPNKRR